MAFRTNSLGRVYLDVQMNLARLKAYLQGVLFQMGEEPTTSYKLFEVLATLKQARDLMDEVAQTPGIADYAINEQNDPLYDIVTEYNALRTAINDVLDWMVASYPRDTTGVYVLVEELDTNGNRIPRYFQTNELGDLPTRLQAIVDLID